MMIEGSGYYICELRSLFNKGTYLKECFYNEETKKFYIGIANVSNRVVRVIEKAVWLNETKI